MRRLGSFIESACHPRSLVAAALLGLGIGAVGVGLLPLGPRHSVAVDAKPVGQVNGPNSNDRTVTRLVAMMMKREHLSKHPLDNEISHRAMDLFLVGSPGTELEFAL